MFACGIFLLLVSGCSTSSPTTSASVSTSSPTAPDLDPRLLGKWQTASGATYSIAASDGEYVLDIVDYDGEVFDVESVSWTEGILSWTYFVPSSEARVSEVTTTITQDRIDVVWENSGGDSGSDVLNRVE